MYHAKSVSSALSVLLTPVSLPPSSETKPGPLLLTSTYVHSRRLLAFVCIYLRFSSRSFAPRSSSPLSFSDLHLLASPRLFSHFYTVSNYFSWRVCCIYVQRARVYLPVVTSPRVRSRRPRSFLIAFVLTFRLILLYPFTPCIYMFAAGHLFASISFYTSLFACILVSFNYVFPRIYLLSSTLHFPGIFLAFDTGTAKMVKMTFLNIL